MKIKRDHNNKVRRAFNGFAGFIFILLLFVSCQEKKKYDFGLNNSSIQLIDSIHDLGIIPAENTRRECDMRLRNNGTEPLIIKKIETSCGCTEAVFSSVPIQPLDTSVIHIIYNREGQPNGRFHKELTIYSNSKAGLAKMTIIGENQTNADER